jgi:hypothetical protein
MSSYHGWTHVPKEQGGTDPIPGAAAAGQPQLVLTDGGTTVPTDTWMPVPNSTVYKRNDPDDTYFSWTTTDTGDTGNDRFEVTLESEGREGRFFLDAVVLWDQVGSPPFVGAAFYEIQITTGATLINPTLTAPIGFWRDDPDGPMVEFQRITAIIDFDPFWPGEGGRTFKPRVRQTSGADRGITGVYLKLVWFDKIGTSGDWVSDFV